MNTAFAPPASDWLCPPASVKLSNRIGHVRKNDELRLNGNADC